MENFFKWIDWIFSGPAIISQGIVNNSLKNDKGKLIHRNEFERRFITSSRLQLRLINLGIALNWRHHPIRFGEWSVDPREHSGLSDHSTGMAHSLWLGFQNLPFWKAKGWGIHVRSSFFHGGHGQNEALAVRSENLDFLEVAEKAFQRSEISDGVASQISFRFVLICSEKTFRLSFQICFCHFMVEEGYHSMRIFLCPRRHMENRILEKQI